MASYTPLPKDEKMVDVPISPPVVVSTEPTPTPRCFMNRCCGCFSLATGIAILGFLDLFDGVSKLFAVLALVVARTHEHAIDETLAHLMSNQTATFVSEKIAQVNFDINVAATFAPLLLLAGLVTVAAGTYGIRASKGCAVSARKFYVWKFVRAVWAVISTLGFRGNFFQAMMFVYFALVARSYWFKLAADADLVRLGALPRRRVALLRRALLLAAPPGRPLQRDSPVARARLGHEGAIRVLLQERILPHHEVEAAQDHGGADEVVPVVLPPLQVDANEPVHAQHDAGDHRHPDTMPEAP